MPSALQLPPLFSSGDALDPAYTNLRDEVSEPARVCKGFSECLWARYYPYADDHFLTEIRRDFSARFWEMYLTCTLLEYAPTLGYAVSCRKPGPDVLIEHEGRRIWIEAVIATDGDPAMPDSAVLNQSGEIPDQKIILRYTNAINAKHSKYAAYRDKGTISEDDAYVAAIDAYPLSYRWADPEIPRILKALFPIGAYEILLDRNTRQIVGSGHQFRRAVKKVSGVEVGTDIFLDNQYRGISAVLHSYANAYSKPPMGADFTLVHNPLALQPVPLGVLPSEREYQATPVVNEYELTSRGGTLSTSGQH